MNYRDFIVRLYNVSYVPVSIVLAKLRTVSNHGIVRNIVFSKVNLVSNPTNL